MPIFQTSKTVLHQGNENTDELLEIFMYKSLKQYHEYDSPIVLKDKTRAIWTHKM